jgi:hypothetical protein
MMVLLLESFDSCHPVCEDRDGVDVCEMKLAEPGLSAVVLWTRVGT